MLRSLPSADVPSIAFALIPSPSSSAVDTLEDQMNRAWEQLQVYDDKLQSYTFLSQLHNQNETLFFALVQVRRWSLCCSLTLADHP